MVLARGLSEFSSILTHDPRRVRVEQDRKTEVAHVAHTLGFRSPNLVPRLVNDRRSSLC